ncbi:MAG: tail fiber domain-containing protein, partial [Candidatus Margulisiibacteriota bacterium]
NIRNNGTGDSIYDDSGAKLTAAGVFTNGSDRNKKQNIRDIQYGLPELLRLHPVAYNTKVDGRADIGFIAQEVKEVIPEVVYGEEGNMSLSYGQLTSVLTKAIQELKQQKDKEITELKARSEAQQKEIEALKAKMVR